MTFPNLQCKSLIPNYLPWEATLIPAFFFFFSLKPSWRGAQHQDRSSPPRPRSETGRRPRHQLLSLCGLCKELPWFLAPVDMVEGLQRQNLLEVFLFPKVYFKSRRCSSVVCLCLLLQENSEPGGVWAGRRRRPRPCGWTEPGEFCRRSCVSHSFLG